MNARFCGVQNRFFLLKTALGQSSLTHENLGSGLRVSALLVTLQALFAASPGSATHVFMSGTVVAACLRDPRKTLPHTIGAQPELGSRGKFRWIEVALFNDPAAVG